MRPNRYTIFAALFVITCLALTPSFGQLGISFDLKKPQEYDERVLRSEKSDQKKFTLPTRIIQNTVTHYNYVFNANNKLSEVLERAKAAHKDDYSKLLPFYNYQLDVTAKDSIQLDSIVYKSETGIALHDLRNDWADNLYLLWGAAYYLQKKFDSAYLMFQFINYAFAEKEKDGYYKTIGSNRDGTSAFSIATKEKTSLPKKVFSTPPSRNDAFIWQIRNFLAQDQFAEAASLIVTLRSDPNFPKRLQNDLEEVQAWWFYKQNMWDSAAPHLANALGNATNKQEKARWEYLVAQLYELGGNYKEAEKFYAKCIHHTTDLVMDVYARLNSIRVNKTGGENYIDKNIAELLKMAKRDKYEDYRDIIYYMAAQMQMERKNIDGALPLLLKSTQYNSGEVTLRNRAFLQLADLAFQQRKYRQAYNFYDSLKLDDPTLPDVKSITARKEMLGKVAFAIETIEREDSLQRIAAMPEEQRREFIKKLVRQLRKAQGLKDEVTVSPGSPFAQASGTPSLFTGNETKGEWYFYNAAYLSKGQSDFKARWGNRPNVDNWRRSAAIAGIVNNSNPSTNPNNVPGLKTGKGSSPADAISFDALNDSLPLTPEKMEASNELIHASLFDLGKLYAQEVEDCASAIQTFESLRTRFPQSEKMDEVLFNLYYCYTRTGDPGKAADIKKLMSEKFAQSNFTTIVMTGKNPLSKTANTDATKAYEKVYELFIEGNFAEAIAQKKEADQVYGKNYWTPQLLYIEAVYYIKQREDSTATRVLKSITTQFPASPLAKKAATLIDVLSRRNQIEEELRNLVIQKPRPDSSSTSIPVSVNMPPITKQDTATKKPTQQPVVITPPPPAPDTTAKKAVLSAFTFSPDAAHYVAVLLNKVDPVYVNEAKNAFYRYNREKFYNKIMTTEVTDINAENRLLLISPFKNAEEAVDYITKTRPLAPTDIIPWLKNGKYSFYIITNKNLDLLKANKDLDNYINFLNQKMPGKF
jgi:tetratricopeptide (TPR) repeat protein